MVTRRPTRRAWVLGGITLALILWAAVAAFLVLGAAASLERAEDLLPVARDAVATADVDTATSVLDDARDELRDADAALSNPLVAAFRVVPVFGADLRAATAIASGGAEVGEAASETVTALEQLPGGMGALLPSDGAFPVAAIDRLAPPLRRTADATARAIRTIEAAPGSGRIDRISTGRDRVLEQLAPVATQAGTAAQLAEQLPRFLGGEGPRTYLFGASTPAELRGTGGFIGSVSLLRIEDGRPEFGTFEPANDLPILEPDALPAPVAADARRWARYGGTGNWLTLNRTPHFPAAAQVMMEHWEATQGDAVDGIVVADPFALEALLELAGPAEVPGYGVRLDADSVVDFVTNGAYAVFEDEDQRKAVLGAVSAATLERFLESGSDAAPPAELLGRLSEVASGGHVVAYVADDEVQRAFSRIGLTGELLDPDGDLVNVVLNSGSVSKVDYYAERRIEHEATLLAGGATESELTVGIANEAPTSGQPPYIIGPNSSTLDAGGSLVDVSVYLAKSATFRAVPPEEEGFPSFTETELGHPVHDGWVRIPSGQRVERTYRWTTADAWSTTPDGVLEYEVLFQGQTVIRPTELTLRVNVPSGFEVLDVPDGADVEGDALVWNSTVRGDDVTLRVRLRPLSER